MISFREAVARYYRNYFNFQGRASRAEYWWPVLMQIGVYAILAAAYFLLVNNETFMAPGDVPALPLGVVIIATLFVILNIVPSLSIAARRFHDLDQTGWLVLVFMIANAVIFVTVFAQIIWFALRGTLGANQYGPDPYGYDADIFG